MSHSVRRYVLGDTGQQGIARHQPLHAPSRQTVEITASVNLFTAAIADKQRADRVLALIQILLYPTSCRFADENRPVFLPLAAHHKLTSLQINMVPIQSY